VTPEQRLDRLERIAKLFVRAGLRARRDMREMNEKINILIDVQIRNDERFAKSDERFARFEERCAEYDLLFAEYAKQSAEFNARLKEQGARTDETLRILAELVKSRPNGN
jgi:hypothetical protein